MGFFHDIEGTQQKRVHGQTAKPVMVRDAGNGERNNDSELTENRYSRKTHQNAPESLEASRTIVYTKNEKKPRTSKNPLTMRLAEASYKDEKPTAGKKRRNAQKIKPEIMTESGADAALIPHSIEDVESLLPVWVSDWCASNDVQDMRKASPLIYKAMCIYIGKTYIKPSRIIWADIQPSGGRHGNGVAGAYDPAKVLRLWDTFQMLCASCDKVPFQTSFAAFCGASLAYVREYVENLTSSGLNIAQKTRTAELDAIRQRVTADPVGRLAILNNELYAQNGGQADQTHVRTVEAIPRANGFSLIGTQKLD